MFVLQRKLFKQINFDFYLLHINFTFLIRMFLYAIIYLFFILYIFSVMFPKVREYF